MTPVVAGLCAGQRRISLKAKSFTIAPLRYIAPADATQRGNLTLGQGLLAAETIAQPNNHGFPFGETLLDTAAYFQAGVPHIQILKHRVVDADDVHKGQRSPVPLGI